MIVSTDSVISLGIIIIITLMFGIVMTTSWRGK